MGGGDLPVITVRKERFWRLLGKRLGDGELTQLLHDLGLDVEEITGEEFRAEYNPNRPDYSSPVGLARAAKGLLEIELGAPRYRLRPPRTYVKVDPRLREIRPYIVAAVVRGLSLDLEALEELIAMQEDLHWVLGRDRRKVSIGLHNLDAVRPPFEYRAVRGDEVEFVPLGEWRRMNLEEILRKHEKGVKYAHLVEGKPLYPLLTDSRGEVLSFPPIINSILTELSEETRNIFIDVTGTDLDAVGKALNILTTALEEMGGRVEQVRVRYSYPDFRKTLTTPDYRVKRWRIKADYVNEVLGLDLSIREIRRALRRMRHDVKVSGGWITVSPPPYRVDIMHPVDLVEDVAMGVGYGSLEIKQPETIVYGSLHPLTRFEEIVRATMLGLGFTEVMNFTLSNEETEYWRMNVEPHPHITLRNPVSRDYSILRTWLLPGLLRNLSDNKGSLYPQKLFEVGDVIHPDEGLPEKARRVPRLACVSTHSEASYSEIKSVAEELLRNLMITGWELNPIDEPPFMEGRAAEINLNGERIGVMGEIHPEVLEKWGLEMPVTALELYLDKILPHYT